MTPGELEAHLHRHIPISAAMGVHVVACDASGATLRAPLKPNVNHRATVFGGSASAVAILAGWTWLTFALRSAHETAQLVIQSNSMEYLAPIASDFQARCDAPDHAAFGRFLATLKRRTRARIEVHTVLTCGRQRVAEFSGQYVAVR